MSRPTTEIFGNYGSNFHLNHERHRSNLGIMRMHPHYEAFMVTQTPVTATIYINGSSYKTDQPFLLIISPFSLHGVDLTVTNGTIERYIAHFGDEMIQTYPDVQEAVETCFQKISGAVFLLQGDCLQKCRSLFALSNTYPETSEVQRLIFPVILKTILISDCERLDFGKNKNILQIQQIIKYMQEHLAEPISAESVAQQFYISRSKLDKDIRKYTMLSFRQLLNELRLCNAEYLLRNPKLKISDIAVRSGFENENYFFTLFKNYKGTTPLKYQKNAGLHYKRIK